MTTPDGTSPSGSTPSGNPLPPRPAYNPSGDPRQTWSSPQYGGHGQHQQQQPSAPEPEKSSKTVGVSALVASVLIAGLLGGGIGAGAVYAIGHATGENQSAESPAAEEAQDVSPEDREAAGINRDSNTTPITDAAAVASPSVVTLSVVSGSSAGSGSGVVLDTEGHILTNTHVVTLGGASADTSVTVQISNGQVYQAEIVGTDPASDLAVVKIDAEDLKPIELGSSGDLNVGDQTIAIGAPLGLSGTVTEGIVSKLDRTIAIQSAAVPEQQPEEPSSRGNELQDLFEFYFPSPDRNEPPASQGAIYVNVIQTDAAINPGNSGGALVDSRGRLIGVNVAIASAGGGNSSDAAGNIGVGFAIPVDYAQRIAEDLIAEGSASHGFLGVTVTPRPADVSGGSSSSSVFAAGAEVVEVVPGGPASQAGLAPGDVITAVNDRPVEDSQGLTAAVQELRAGEEMTLSVVRNGQEEDIEVTVGDAENA